MNHSHPTPGERPILLLTCGDPSGIGPEIVASAWARTAAHARGRLRVVAAPEIIDRAADQLQGGAIEGVEIVSPDDPRESHPGRLLVIPSGDRAETIIAGRITAAGGRAALAALQAAFSLVRDGRGDAIVTGPLHKEAIRAAGHDVPGHTEFLARACGLPDAAASMMLWLPHQDAARGGLGVVHATLHQSLRTAVEQLSGDAIIAAGRRLHDLLRTVLARRPRIAIAALNPHGGEGGLFGDEESRLIVPAITELERAGLDVAGPLPADTLFLRASRGEFDGAVAMYHDQGHIPIKLLGMHRAVNITLGLPLVRTSVAHGTAFDIVGKGTADPSSMLAAIDMAARLAAAGWPRATTAATAAAVR
jgi:4-hydroxythreonine-4-phosphate dehydrogenase